MDAKREGIGETGMDNVKWDYEKVWRTNNRGKRNLRRREVEGKVKFVKGS